MGSIIDAHCDCGYQKGKMLLGGGMMSFTTYCNFPHYCPECNILFEANLFESKMLCPECGDKKVIAYDDERACMSEGKVIFSWNAMAQIGREVKLTDGEYICPDCGKFNLSFYDFGYWD